MRSYPFAMVFVVTRVIGFFLKMTGAGLFAFVATIWTVNAVACFLPSFVIAWQSLETKPKRIAPSHQPAQITPSGD